MIYILVALMIWGSSFTVAKYAYTMFDPAVVVQLRLVIASLIALPLFLKNYFKISSHLKRQLWGISFLMFPIGIFLQFIGLSYTSAVSAVTIIGTEPILALIFGFLFFKQSVKWYDWILSIIVFLGILLLALGSRDDLSVNVWGLSLVFMAGMGFILAIHLGKNIMQNIEPHIYTAIILVQGSLLCIPMTLGLTQHWHMNFSWLGLCAVIYLGVGCSWLAYQLWNKGLQQTPTHISGMLIALEPVFGVIIAMLLLGERMTLLTACGSFLVLSAAILSTSIPILVQHLSSKSDEIHDVKTDS